MTRRRVTNVKKDNNGNIIGLCNKTNPKLFAEDNWDFVTREDAIFQIKNNLYHYFVRWEKDVTAVLVAHTSHGYEYLRTDRDSTTVNNLEELPAC